MSTSCLIKYFFSVLAQVKGVPGGFSTWVIGNALLDIRCGIYLWNFILIRSVLTEYWQYFFLRIANMSKNFIVGQFLNHFNRHRTVLDLIVHGIQQYFLVLTVVNGCSVRIFDISHREQKYRVLMYSQKVEPRRNRHSTYIVLEVLFSSNSY